MVGESESEDCSVVSDSAIPWIIQSMEFSRSEYWSGESVPSPGGLPNPGIEPRSPALQADSLQAELPEKPKNTGVDSLSLLQGTFPAQEWNQDLLHRGQIESDMTEQHFPFHLYTHTHIYTHTCTDYIYNLRIAAVAAQSLSCA